MVYCNVQRPRLKRTTETFTAPGGDFHLIRPSDDNDVVVEAPTDEQRELLLALDGTHQLEELEKRFGREEVGQTISQLRELQVIEDAADDDRIPAPERERFDRQLRCFSDAGGAAPTPSECQQRLREAKVAVLGVGGLGGASARALASCAGSTATGSRPATSTARPSTPSPTSACSRSRWRRRGCVPSTPRCG